MSDVDQQATEDAAVANGAASAYFAWVMGQSDAARQRASVAFTMVSFIVGAIVAAGLFGDIQKEAVWVRLFGIAALAAWLTAAGLLLYTAARDVPAEDPQKESADDIDDLVQSFVDQQRHERNETYERLDRATRSAAVAMVLTVVAIAAVVLDNPAPDRAHGQIVLTPDGVKALPPECRAAAVPLLGGSLAKDALDGEFVEINIDGSECGGRTQQVEMSRDTIVGVQRR